MQGYSPSRDGINRRRLAAGRGQCATPEMAKAMRHAARQEAKRLVRLELSPKWDIADACADTQAEKEAWDTHAYELA